MKLFYSKQSKVVFDVLNKEKGKGHIYEASLEKINGISEYPCELLTFDEVIEDLKKTYKLIKWSKKQLGEYAVRHFNAINIDGFYFNYEYNLKNKTNEIIISFKDQHYYIDTRNKLIAESTGRL